MNTRYLHFFVAFAAVGCFVPSSLGQSPDDASPPTGAKQASPVSDETQKKKEALERRIAEAKEEIDRLNVTLEQLKKVQESAEAAANDAAAKADEARRNYYQTQQQLIAVRIGVSETEAQLNEYVDDKPKAPAAAPNENNIALQSSRQEIREKLLTLTALETELQFDCQGKRVQFDRLRAADPNQLPLTPDLVKQLDGNQLVKATRKALDAAEIAHREYVSNDEKDPARIRRIERRINEFQKRLETAKSLATSEIILKWRNQAWLNLTEAEDQLHAVRDRMYGARNEMRMLDRAEAERLKKPEESKN